MWYVEIYVDVLNFKEVFVLNVWVWCFFGVLVEWVMEDDIGLFQVLFVDVLDFLLCDVVVIVLSSSLIQLVWLVDALVLFDEMFKDDDLWLVDNAWLRV